MEYYAAIKKTGEALHVWKDLFNILLGNKSKYNIATFM